MVKTKDIDDERLNELIKASILTEELFYPYQQLRLNDAGSNEDKLRDEINSIFFTSSPFQRVLKGEKYDVVEAELKKEIENYGLIKTES
jgi:hypothetical protein